MIVFSTKIPLKNVTISCCIELFKKWIINSPHYSLDISELSEENFDNYQKSEDNVSFSAISYFDDFVKISAVQLKQTDEKGIWCTDCLVTEESHHKFLLVQLDYTCDDYSISTPTPHKPYVIRLFIEAGICDKDWVFPVNDQSLSSDLDYFDACVAVMNGESDNQLPMIYISKNYMNRTELKHEALARELSGIAHVVVEDSRDTGEKLRERTNENNVYGGYIGIYYPRSIECEKYSIAHYSDRNVLFSQIVKSVQRALVYRSEYTEYSWNQVLLLKSRQKMSEVEMTSQRELNDFLKLSDTETNSLKNIIKDLNGQLRKKQAVIDQLQERVDRQSNENQAFYNKGIEPEFYDGEYSNLLYYLLSNGLKQKQKDSRGYHLIKSLLDANPKKTNAESVLERIREIFANNSRLTPTLRTELSNLGFDITEEGKHYKLVFHDPRYTFSMAKSPSDHRGAKNFASDIMKKIDIKK